MLQTDTAIGTALVVVTVKRERTAMRGNGTGAEQAPVVMDDMVAVHPPIGTKIMAKEPPHIPPLPIPLGLTNRTRQE
jgi:hypothetical protein